MTPQMYCEQKVRQSASSFYYSFLFLSSKQRNAIIALYAFCREIDDIVDNLSYKQGDKNIAQTKLNWWKSEILSAFNHQASHPIAIAISDSLHHYEFQVNYFLDIIHGMEMDLNHQGFDTMNDLKNYCYHVAGAVGLLSIEIFGYHKENQKNVENFAKNLAISLQLINILRDVKEDLRLNRIYIPTQEMARLSVTKKDFLALADKQKEDNKYAIQQLFSTIAKQAEDSFKLAMHELKSEDRYQQRSAIIMASIYFAILDKIKKNNYPVLQQRIKIYPFHKLWLAWKTARQEAKHEQQRIKNIDKESK